MKNQRDLYRNRIRFKFYKKGEFKYLSHLDISRIIIRALNRAGFNLVYSQGYNPRPQLSFSQPTPLGIESMAEYADIDLYDDVSEDEFKNRINRELKQQIQVTDVRKIAEKADKLMNEIGLSFYIFTLYTGLSNKSLLDEFYRAIDSGLIKGYPFYRSIFKYEVLPEGEDYNIILLKLSGYAKIFKEIDNLFFKFNDFYLFLRDWLKKYKIKIKSARKEELFILGEGTIKTPMEVI
jgi:hypothetical protein